MPYEVRLSGRPPRRFESEEEAVAAVAATLAENPDAEPELFDLATGRPVGPAATKAMREELKTRVGF